MKRLFITGGDTTKQVFHSMDIDEFKLLDEMEVGIPLGIIMDEHKIITMTKAGGFGSSNALVQAYKILKGGANI